MTEQEQRNIFTGILGTGAFHLLLLVIFLTIKLGKVKDEHQEIIHIEFSEQEYKTIEEIIEESKPKHEPIEQLSQQTLNNIASNTAEKMNDELSTEKYLEEIMEDLGMDELNPKHDNTLPEETVLSPKKEKVKKEDNSANFGQTRITYNVPGRKGRHIERPIYRCQGGGTVALTIQVDQDGFVVGTAVQSSSTSDNCVVEMAINSAKNSRFNTDYNAAKKVEGTITYIFVAQ